MRKKTKGKHLSLLSAQERWERGRHSDRYQRIFRKFLKSGTFDEAHLIKLYGVRMPFPPKFSVDEISKLEEKFRLQHLKDCPSNVSLFFVDRLSELVAILPNPAFYDYKFEPNSSASKAADLIVGSEDIYPREKVGKYDRLVLSIDLIQDSESILSQIELMLKDAQVERKKNGLKTFSPIKKRRKMEKDLIVFLIGVLSTTGSTPSQISHLSIPRDRKTISDYIATYKSWTNSEKKKYSEKFLKRIRSPIPIEDLPPSVRLKYQ